MGPLIALMRLTQAFATAVEKDQASLKNGSVKFDNTLALKEKIFKQITATNRQFQNVYLWGQSNSPICWAGESFLEEKNE